MPWGFGKQAAASVSIICAKIDLKRAATLSRRLAERGVSAAATAAEPGRAALSEIEDALRGARCVIVVWPSKRSAELELMTEIADRARGRDALISVCLTPEPPPLGYAGVPTVDLSGPRFSASALDALAAACQEKLGPQPAFRRRRWARLLAGGGATCGVVFAVTGFDVLGAQEQLCNFPKLQPAVSDFCGALGMGDSPTRDERLHWESWDKRSCKQLQQHVHDYPKGKYLTSAAALLATKRSAPTGRWVEEQQKLDLFVAADADMSGDLAQSKARALRRGQMQSERLCDLYGEEAGAKVRSAAAEPEHWNCADGACSFEGHALCTVERQELEDICASI